MFKKLNIPCPELDYSKLKGELGVKFTTFSEFLILDQDYVLDNLSNKIKFSILPNSINVSEIVYPGATPHTDRWPTVINFYLDAGSDETFFWKEIEPSITDRPNPSGPKTGTKSYRTVPLEKTGSFIANTGDCYLMDIWYIHSVRVSAINSPRKLLRLLWYDLSFDEVLQSIEVINELKD